MVGPSLFRFKTEQLTTIGRYSVAVAGVLASTAAALLLPEISEQIAFLFYFPAVLFAIWYGGFRPAVLASVLSALSANFFCTPPRFTLKISPLDFLLAALFVMVFTSISFWLDWQKRRADYWLNLQHQLLEAASGAVFVTGSDHKIISWHLGAEKMYGWTATEALGKLPQELLKTKYPESLETLDHQLKLTGRWQGRLVRMTKAGKTVVTESTWVLDPNTGLILKSDLDVTARAQAEEDRTRLNSALRALSGVNQTLIRASSEDELLQCVTQVISAEGQYPLAVVAFPNEDAKQSVRFAAYAGPATSYVSELSIQLSSQSDSRGPIGRVLTGQGPVVIHDTQTDSSFEPWRELAHKYNLGSVAVFPIEYADRLFGALAVYSEKIGAFQKLESESLGELGQDLGFGIHMLRLRNLAEEQRRASELLEEQFRRAQKLEAVGRLAGGVAHDFNNLLMVISAQIEMLSNEVQTETAIRRLNNIQDSTERAAQLTRQLLAFSRRQSTKPTVTTMNEIVLGVDELIHRLTGEDIEIHQMLASPAWPIKVDKSQIEQVIMNLVVNARDAMPGGGHFRLEVQNVNIQRTPKDSNSLLPDGEYVMLTASDTGTGMSDEVKEKIFEPFFSTKEPGKGTGLGLSMVYGIVKQSGGFIEVDSKPGQGSCFKIYLPVSDLPQSSRDPVQNPGVAAEESSLEILVVEDEAQLRDAICEFLSAAGHKVASAGSVEDALKLSSKRKERFDLLLTDVVLRGGNGKNLANLLRDGNPDLKVIFMSGYTPDSILHHGGLEGESGFLQKPFSRAALLSKVRGTF